MGPVTAIPMFWTMTVERLPMIGTPVTLTVSPIGCSTEAGLTVRVEVVQAELATA